MPSQSEFDALNTKLTKANSDLKACQDGRKADADKCTTDKAALQTSLTKAQTDLTSTQQALTALKVANGADRDAFLVTFAKRGMATPEKGYTGFGEILGDMTREFSFLDGAISSYRQQVDADGVSIEKANELIAALKSTNGHRWVDDGAKALAQYVSDRMPGLRISPLLGGPSLSDVQQVTADSREVLSMSLTCPDGRLYAIEIYRSGPEQ